MYKPKSKYIINKIKDCSFKNRSAREHIFDLIKMEKLFVKGCANSGDAMLSQTLHERYPEEFNIIFKEVDKKGYKKYLKKQKSMERTTKADTRKWKREEIKQEQEQKKVWINLGGIE